MVDWTLNLKANRLLLQVVLIPIVLMLAVPGRSSVCRVSRAALVFAGLLPFGCWLAVDCSVWLVRYRPRRQGWGRISSWGCRRARCGCCLGFGALRAG